ncbi:hypothetical protein SAMN05216198_3378 [Halopseudomonas litoralis]|uniref:Uncharacterized protein n=1 Tax=Halopseudomonas litoralis TaxID=797277 RepID=A0A1H1WTU4_9GAMM|nr:hypothetical protein SAMN05216198_3378 [Halopseudomonas litoralis]
MAKFIDISIYLYIIQQLLISKIATRRVKFW